LHATVIGTFILINQSMPQLFRGNLINVKVKASSIILYEYLYQFSSWRSLLKECKVTNYSIFFWVSVYLRMLSSNTSSSTIGSSKDDGYIYLSSRHVIWLCSGIDDMINCLKEDY